MREAKVDCRYCGRHTAEHVEKQRGYWCPACGGAWHYAQNPLDPREPDTSEQNARELHA